MYSNGQKIGEFNNRNVNDYGIINKIIISYKHFEKVYKNALKKLLKSYICLYLIGFVEIFLC